GGGTTPRALDAAATNEGDQSPLRTMQTDAGVAGRTVHLKRAKRMPRRECLNRGSRLRPKTLAGDPGARRSDPAPDDGSRFAYDELASVTATSSPTPCPDEACASPRSNEPPPRR